MNYIKTLQADLIDARQRNEKALELVIEFRAHLASKKFHSDERERRDLIAVSDVLNRLSDIRDELYGIA